MNKKIVDYLNKAIGVIRKKSKKTITYEGVYNTFDDVFKKYKDVTSYNSSTSLGHELNKAKIELINLEKGEIPNYSYELVRLNVISIAISMMEKRNISILDIGGGLGILYMNLIYSCAKKNIQMTIMELPDTVIAGRDLFRTYNDVRFTDNFPNGEINKFDLVNFGSSLQYFENYSELIKKSCNIGSRIISINDTTMGNADTFVCAQVNMKGRIIPRLVFNIDEIVFLIENSGYNLIHKSKNYHKIHNFHNYSDEKKNTSNHNLIFIKK